MSTLSSIRAPIFLSLLILTCLAKVQAAELAGIVRDSVDGSPVANATVILLETWDTTYTDADGFYYFSSADPTAATILVGHTSYRPILASPVTSCCGQYTGGFTGNTNCDTDGTMNLSDVTRLIDRIYLSKAPLCCEENGNVDGDVQGKLNLTDVTKLIDHIYLSRASTAPCF